MTPTQRHEFFARLAKVNPHPHSELRFGSPFELLVSVVLAAQATDASVNKATERLYAVANTPRAMLALGEGGLRDYIKTIGLYNTKAKHVLALCQRLVDDFGGEVPRTREALATLPGVGWKTASVVANVAFGAPTVAVDTHVFRVANRTGLAPGKNPRAVCALLERTVPAEYLPNAHHWLVLHGRYICKARVPECWRCPVADLCAYPDKTPAPDTASARGPGGPPTDRRRRVEAAGKREATPKKRK
ncbi:MAG TPA: endonuclease III [Nevskiaceae bacterium]